MKVILSGKRGLGVVLIVLFHLSDFFLFLCNCCEIHMQPKANREREQVFLCF